MGYEAVLYGLFGFYIYYHIYIIHNPLSNPTKPTNLFFSFLSLEEERTKMLKQFLLLQSFSFFLFNVSNFFNLSITLYRI